MGIPEAKQKWQALITEINSIPASYEKADLVALGAEKLKEIARELKDQMPTNISQVSDANIVVRINDQTYDLELSTGNLTPR